MTSRDAPESQDAPERNDGDAPERERSEDDGRSEAADQSGHSQESDGSGHGDHSGHDHSGHEQMFRRRFWICLALSIPVLLTSETLQGWLGFSLPAFPGDDLIGPVLSTVVFVIGGLPFLRMAGSELAARKPGMMALISLAITVAFAFSLATVFLLEGEAFFWELVTLIDVMLLGHWIEMRSVRQASGALDELAKLLPDTAERIGEGGRTEEVPVTELEKGDLVLVRPGASVPADGTVKDGESEVNEAMITGESKAVPKGPGDEVVGGTVNGDGSLRVEVGAVGEETALAGIMKLVEEAQRGKSRGQMLADRAAGLLFYIALGVAILAGIGWWFVLGWDISILRRVATVLVIACPHALGLAVPLVLANTTALGARNGLLVRDRMALEEILRIDTVVFDKTGTLTEGEQSLADACAGGGVEGDRALAVAAAVEGDSEHMIARALRAAAEERELEVPKASGFEASKGRGVRADVDGEEWRVGGPNMLGELDLKPGDDLRRFADEQGEQGRTVVYLVHKGEPVAAFSLQDRPREDSRKAVELLREQGLNVVMMTGDSEAVARAVARDLGIDEWFAGVLPENKDNRIQELQDHGRRVAMVGDGINDAPALTRADVGIAIGGGTDVAVQSSAIILVNSRPLDVARVLRLARLTRRKMVQNLWLAAGYNVFALPAAAGVLAPWGIVLSPAIGALFMSASTVVVAINAQLMRRAKI
ncbi:heavy metal translocating P-type ATPase [Caenispirillum salinarum]|uniref:heavy metal translocating P-type ATPase n=1 Tax=Caenispirillum salinarum TaxID=859058 RepID=UPI00385001C8